jgi:plastocyanin
MSRRSNLVRLAGLLAIAALAVVACAPDGPDAYGAPEDDAPPATRAPSTSEPEPQPESEEGAADGAAGEGADDADEPTSVETFPPNGETVVVLGVDNTFREETIEIEAGTEVLWENRGRNDHNVLPVDETEDWGAQTEDFLPGDEYGRVFDTPGEYPYYCSIHGTTDVGMIGTVIVTG